MEDGGSVVSIVLDIQKREHNEIPAHFLHEIKTILYDAIGVNVPSRKIMRFPHKPGVNSMRPILLLFSYFRLDPLLILLREVQCI